MALTGLEEVDVSEWIDSLENVLRYEGQSAAERLLRRLLNRAARDGVRLKYEPITTYVNTIPADKEPVYPGNVELEARLDTLIGWNAMAMVVRANRKEHGIGGRLASYAGQQPAQPMRLTASTRFHFSSFIRCSGFSVARFL